jgi:hypothetical protein
MRRCLSGAASWGVLDMFGGGFMATTIKHDRPDAPEGEEAQATAGASFHIDEARALLPEAK